VDYQIHVMNADGTGVRGLGQKGTGPTWSPDGTKIAFTSEVESTGGLPSHEIHVMNADGTDLRNLGVDGYSPVWSPDGSTIAFSRDTFAEGRYLGADVYVVNADGSTLTNLTNGDGAMSAEPDWSPDGRRIAFVRAGDEMLLTRYVHIMEADGSGVARIPVSSDAPELGAARGVAWSPR
jgi:Tol biopolymer transport system component